MGAVGAQVAPGRGCLSIALRITSSVRMQALSGRTRESGKRPRLTSGLRGARCWGRTVSIDSEVRTLDHLNDPRHSHPSAIPTPPPFPSVARGHSHPSAILRRHSCAPSVIPAAGIHATAQPCDEPPSAIPILPPFLRPFRRPLRHSCGGRNPCDRPTVQRASIRHSHPSAIPAPPPSFLRPLRHSCAPSVIPAEAGIHATAQPCDEPPSARRPTRVKRAAGDRAPSNIGSALDPTDRMDSCLRRNDGQAGVTEGRRSDRAAPEPARTYKGGSRRSPR